MGRKALFLDRDGTLIPDKDYLCNPDEVELIKGVREALGRLLEAGFLLFMHSNQSGVGRGYFEMDAVHACNERLYALLGWEDSRFVEVCIAPEASDEGALYRKPLPKFPLEMFVKYDLKPENCSMVGDRMSDWQTGLNAGMQIVAVETGKPITPEHRAWLAEQNGALYANFPEFADVLLTQS